MPDKLHDNGKISRKEDKFVKNVVKHADVAKATDLAGLSKGYGYHLMKQSKILNRIQQELENVGLGDITVAKKLKKMLKATMVKKDGGREYLDNHAVLKALDMIIKIKGGYAPEETISRQEKMIFIITPETIKGLKDAKVGKEDLEIIEVEAITEEEDGTAS